MRHDYLIALFRMDYTIFLSYISNNMGTGIM